MLRSKEFGNRVMEAVKKGLSRDELAKMIGTSGPIVGRYERGEIKPSIEMTTQLTEAHEVSLDYLVDSTDVLLEK